MPSPKERTRAAAYAAHLARIRASSWRLGVLDGRWRLTRRGPDTDGRWVLLDEHLEAFDDIDPAAERRRVSAWVYEVLEVRSVWQWRDYAAAAEGREAFDLEVKS